MPRLAPSSFSSTSTSPASSASTSGGSSSLSSRGPPSPSQARCGVWGKRKKSLIWWKLGHGLVGKLLRVEAPHVIGANEAEMHACLRQRFPPVEPLAVRGLEDGRARGI